MKLQHATHFSIVSSSFCACHTFSARLAACSWDCRVWPVCFMRAMPPVKKSDSTTCRSGDGRASSEHALLTKRYQAGPKGRH